MNLPNYSRTSRIEPKVPIPAKDWNTALDEFRQNRPLIVGTGLSGTWTHPWRPTAKWDFDSNEWRVSIKPGFVNARFGHHVEVILDEDRAPEATVARAQADDSVYVGEDRVRARLIEKPEVPVNADRMRKIGPDAESTGIETNSDGFSGEVTYEPVPSFFKALGVGDPPSQSFDLLSGITNGSSLSQDSSQERYLRAFDIVLKQERPSATADWTFGSGDTGGESFYQFDVTYGNLNYRRNAYLTFTPKHSLPITLDLGDRLRGVVNDSGVDEVKIATVYFVSPPGYARDSDPDASWTPYYKNYVYWNLNHETNLLPAQVTPSPISFPVALAGGVGNAAINLFLAENNDAFDAASELLRSRNLEGRFWTT